MAVTMCARSRSNPSRWQTMTMPSEERPMRSTNKRQLDDLAHQAGDFEIAFDVHEGKAEAAAHHQSGVIVL